MSNEEIQVANKKILIKQEINNIKIPNLKLQLLNQFHAESKLDDLLNTLPKQVVISSLERFEKKLKVYQQIETDFPDGLISIPDSYLLLPKLDALRLKLALLCAEAKEREITEVKLNYYDIRTIILNFLKVKFNLKLKYFDLTIKLLEKAIEDPQFDKEFIDAFDLLKLFVNKPAYHPNEHDLQRINNFGDEASSAHVDKREYSLIIRKIFYGLIRELNKKLLFQNLLNQWLKIESNQNNSLLSQFNIIFINNCCVDARMEAEDFNQLIGLVYRALERKHEPIIMKKKFEGIKRIFIKKNMSDYLVEFEKDFIEKISRQIINEPIRLDLQSNVPNFRLRNIREPDVSIYFPVSIENIKIRTKFAESLNDFNRTLERNHASSANTWMKKFTWSDVGSSTILQEIKKNVGSTVANFNEFIKNKEDEVKSFQRKRLDNLNSEENTITDEIEPSKLLMQAKTTLLPIKEKLNAWNLMITPNRDVNYADSCGQTAGKQFDFNQCPEYIVSMGKSINDKYKTLIQRIFEEFEKNNAAIKEKNYWFIQPEIVKYSLFHKIFRRGYINGNYTIKKIKAQLGSQAVFSEINNFILKQSFWTLLTYGIVRWPWMNKVDFAQTWAEQFCLPEVIDRINYLKNKFMLDPHNPNEDILKKIIRLANDFLPFKKNEVIITALDVFKKYIAIQLGEVETLEQKIDERLDRKINSVIKSSSLNKTDFFKNDNLLPTDRKIRDNQASALTAR